MCSDNQGYLSELFKIMVFRHLDNNLYTGSEGKYTIKKFVAKDNGRSADGKKKRERRKENGKIKKIIKCIERLTAAFTVKTTLKLVLYLCIIVALVNIELQLFY